VPCSHGSQPALNSRPCGLPLGSQWALQGSPTALPTRGIAKTGGPYGPFGTRWAARSIGSKARDPSRFQPSGRCAPCVARASSDKKPGPHSAPVAMRRTNHPTCTCEGLRRSQWLPTEARASSPMGDGRPELLTRLAVTPQPRVASLPSGEPFVDDLLRILGARPSLPGPALDRTSRHRPEAPREGMCGRVTSKPDRSPTALCGRSVISGAEIVLRLIDTTLGVASTLTTGRLSRVVPGGRALRSGG